MLRHIKHFLTDLRAAAEASRDLQTEIMDAETGEILIPAKLEKYRTDRHYFTSELYLRQCDRADWQGSPPELQIVISRAIERMRRMGFAMYVHTVYRSPDVQARLRATGRSQVSSGAHQRSMAADVVHSNYHWECSKPFWDLWGVVVKEASLNEGIPITWGGDWKTIYDPAHVELNGWRDFREINPSTPLRRTPRKMLRDHGVKIGSEAREAQFILDQFK